MDGKAVFRFAEGNHAARFPANRKGAAKDLWLTLDWVVCHQANSRIIDHCIKHLHAEPSKFYKNMDRHGNTSVASIPIALHEMVENDLLHLPDPGLHRFWRRADLGRNAVTYEGRK